MGEIEMDWVGTARANAEEPNLEPEVAALLRGLADQIEELNRQLKGALYDAHWAQKRLSAIRARRAQIIRLLDAPTLTEHLDAGGDVLAFPPEVKERRIGPEDRREASSVIGRSSKVPET